MQARNSNFSAHQVPIPIIPSIHMLQTARPRVRIRRTSAIHEVTSYLVPVLVQRLHYTPTMFCAERAQDEVLFFGQSQTTVKDS